MDRDQRNAILSELGARVREHRRAQGWSQEQFAEQAGVHRTYIGAIERGQQNVTVVTLIAIAQALSVDPGELITRP
ncbi:MAG: helix-turn-helix transcriptional regulator [Dehalococcoidia bacterium]